MGVKNTGCAHISFREKNYQGKKVCFKKDNLEDLNKNKSRQIVVKSKIFNIVEWVKENKNDL